MTTIVTRAGKGSALTHNELDTNFTNLNTAKLEAADIAGKADTGHTHTLAAGATNVTITAANLNALDDGVNTTLHFHDADRDRANHTGTQGSSTINDFGAAARTEAHGSLIAGTGITFTPGGAGATATLTLDVTGGGSAITVQDEGSSLATAATTLNFTGAGVTASGTGATKTIDIPGAGTATITVKENGTNVSTVITALDFLGADFDVIESPSGEANVVISSAIARTANVQPLDSDLTTIAGLTATTDSFIQSKSSAWSSRTLAQVQADLLTIAPTVVVESTTGRILAASDNGKVIYCTSASSTTITVPTAFSGYGCVVVRGGTGTVTIAASSTTLNGGSLVLNSQYAALSILPTGTANTFVISGATGDIEAGEETIASATTTSIGGTVSRNISVTGTTTITGFGTVAAGISRKGRFTGALTLTHNATSLILPNAGSNITTAAGDSFEALSLGSGNWVVYRYTKADGTALAGGAGGGDVTKVGTPANNQVGVWTGNGTIEGDSALTFDTATDTLTIGASGKVAFGAVNILDDSAGTTTLSNIDALDATTEATIEAAIDTLANLTSVQGHTVTLTGALVRSGAHSLTMTTTGTTSVTFPVSGTLATQTEAKTEAFCVACSDETTALTTGTAKVTFRMPYAMTLTSLRASVTTAPTGASLIVDVNDSGTTVMTTNKLSIDATEKTSTTAATAHTLTDTALADDAEITIDIDQVGSTVAGAGLKVWFIGTRA